MLLRLLSTGLCVTCVVLLATLQPIRFEVAHIAPRQDQASSLNVVDVADGVAPPQLVALLRLAPDERVIALNDRLLGEDSSATDAIAALAPHAGDYLDLTVSSATTERRVLVLLHSTGTP